MGAERVAVGRIARPHGVRGELAVELHTEFPERFAPGAVVTTESGRTLTVEGSRPHAGRLLVRFREVPDRDAADRLRGEYLFVGADSLPTLADGAYWPHELEGCEVVSEDGRALGRVVEILAGPANDVWAVEGPDGRVLVPAVRDAVISVDVAARRIVVREAMLA